MQSVLFNGTVYQVPNTSDESWGTSLTAYLVAISQGALQKTGGNFTLTAEVNFGATYGLLSQYYKSRSSNLSTAGILRLAVGDTIGWRNNANSGNLLLAVNASDQLTFNGSAVYPGGITALTGDVTATGPGSVAATIANSAVTNAKMANMATGTVKGNISGGAAAPSDLSLVSTATANSVLLRDTNANSRLNSLIENFATTATAAGTTTLTVASAKFQQFTGSTTQDCVLPDATTLVVGQSFVVLNRSTGVVTVKDDGGSTVAAVSAGSQATFLVTDIGTSDGVWDTASSASFSGNSGGILYFNSSTTLASTATLTANQLIIGGGAGTAPSSLAAGSQYQSLVMGASAPGYGAVDLGQAAAITGTLPIGNGGTGQTSAAAAFSALSPITTTGDMIYSSSGTTNSRLAIGSANQVLTSVAGVPTWQTVNAGAKNYIVYNNFNNNATTGWSLGNVSLTSNLPAGTPTFGSGAAGTLALAIESSNPLAGLYSLSYSDSGASTAGNFFASDELTLDEEDQAKVMAFKAYYKVNSGTVDMSGTSSNSFAVAIYNTTSGSEGWIIPAGVFNFVQSSGVGIVQGTFQTPADMETFRFVVYNANATSGAFELFFDDFYLGPQSLAFGPPVSDPSSYTPTLGNMTVSGANSNLSAQYWRVGKTLFIDVNLRTGASGTTSAGTLSVSLPSGLSIDTSAIATGGNASLGSGYWVDVSAASTQANSMSVVYNDTTSVAFRDTSTRTTTGANMNGNDVGVDTVLRFFAKVPISGYSSNTVMSADSATNVVAMRATNTSGQTVNTGANAVLTGWTTVKDSNASFNATTGVYTIPVTGWYRISTNITTNTAAFTAGSSRYGQIKTNGTVTLVLNTVSIWASQTEYLSFSGSANYFYNAGETVSLNFTNATGTNLSLLNSAADNWVSIERLSGPAVVAASESVNMNYGLTGSGTVASSSVLSTISNSYGTFSKNFDSHNAFNTTSGIYTVPISGTYRVSGHVLYNTATWGTQGSTYSVSLAVALNGTTAYQRLAEKRPYTSESYPAIGGTTTIKCVAGDTLRFMTAQNNSGTTAIALLNDPKYNYFSIERVGN